MSVPIPPLETVRESASQQQVLWAETVAESLALIKSTPAQKFLAVQDMGMALKSIKVIQEKHASSRSVTLLERFYPIIERLSAFTKAISAFIQHDPTYAALVWGSILALMELAGSFYKKTEKLADMLSSMTKAMPRFEKYFSLYANSEVLKGALRNIYKACIGFFIFALEFFQHSPIYYMLPLGRTDSRFDYHIKEIQVSKEEFEAEARLVHDIEAANHRAKLEQALPLLIPADGIRQKCFSVPYSRNDNYFGRESELLDLHGMLGEPSRQRSCAVQGSGGLGKTQLALEYAYRHGHFGTGVYQYVFWVRSENEAVLAEGFGRIPSILCLKSNGVANDSRTAAANIWLCETPGWLLVFDNVENTLSLDKYWPSCAHGSIILTTQDNDVCYRANGQLHLMPFSIKYGSEMLLKYSKVVPRSDKEQEQAATICKEVDGLPLLLVGLAGHIRQSQSSLSDIVHLLTSSRKDTRRLLSNKSTASINYQYERPIQMVYEFALRNLSSNAWKFLAILAMMYPEGFRESYFLGVSQNLVTTLIPKLSRLSFIEEVRTPLSKRYLVSIQRVQDDSDDFEYSLHRTLQRVVLDKVEQDPENRQGLFHHGVSILYSAFPKPSAFMVPIYEYWPICEALIPHVLGLHHTFTRFEAPVKGTLLFAELLGNAINYLYEKRLMETAFLILSTAEKIYQAHQHEPKEVLNKEFEGRATNFQTGPGDTRNADECLIPLSLASLEANVIAYGPAINFQTGGIIYRRRARVWAERVISLRKKHLYETPVEKIKYTDRVLLANSYSDFGFQLIEELEWSEAEQWFRESLEMKHEFLEGKKVPAFEFSDPMCAIAFIKQTQGDPTEAHRLIDQAIEIYSEAEGEDDLHTYFLRYHKAIIYTLNKDLESALRLFDTVSEARMRLAGAYSPETRDSTFAVGVMQYRLGLFKESRQSIEKALKELDSGWWAPENILRAKYYLARVLEVLGETERSSVLEIEAVQGKDELLDQYAPEYQRSEKRDIFYTFDFLVTHGSGRFCL